MFNIVCLPQVLPQVLDIVCLQQVLPQVLNIVCAVQCSIIAATMALSRIFVNENKIAEEFGIHGLLGCEFR